MMTVNIMRTGFKVTDEIRFSVITKEGPIDEKKAKEIQNRNGYFVAGYGFYFDEKDSTGPDSEGFYYASWSCQASCD